MSGGLDYWRCGWSLLAVLFALPACGPARFTEEVEGVVTLDGRPVEDIRVVFQPYGPNMVEPGVGSYGTTDAQGRFVLRMADSDDLGAVVGRHSVTFADKQCEDDTDAGTSNAPKSRVPAVPSQRPHSFEVKEGQKNEARFELNAP